MNEKLFPITVEPACKLKWAWSTIWFYDGSTASCHRTKRLHPSLEEFSDFHNISEKIQQREEMLAGNWPSSGGCDFCRKVEEAGGTSDRQFQTSVPGHTPPELEIDPTATNVTPTMVEVYLANTCNLQCVYCDPKNSSRIAQEIEQYGPYKTPAASRENYELITRPIAQSDQFRDKFWEWMEKHSDALRRFHVLGGEPLFQKDIFWKCLTHWDEYPNPELELNVVSNLSIPEHQFKKYLDYTKELCRNGKIKRFDITASIDCWGDDQVYARNGIDLDLFERNMEYLLAQDEDWLRININQTLSVLTIKSVPELIKKINKWKEQRSVIGHYVGTVIDRRILEPTILPKGFWSSTFHEILELMECRENLNWDDEQAIKLMRGTIQQIEQNSVYDSELIEKCKAHLTELDERRGTDWRTVFPYLIAF